MIAAARDLLAVEPDAYARLIPHARTCFLRRRPALARHGARLLRRDLHALCTCRGAELEREHLIVPAHNIVTNAGDQYYAQKGAGETPTNFGTPRMSLTTAQNAPSKTSVFSDLTTIPSSGTKAMDSTFPKTNDNASSPLNPGTVDIDVIAWRVTWGSSEANGTIIGLAIHNNGASGSNPLLNHAAFASSFPKASGETLVTWANHRMNGV